MFVAEALTTTINFVLCRIIMFVAEALATTICMIIMFVAEALTTTVCIVYDYYVCSRGIANHCMYCV